MVDVKLEKRKSRFLIKLYCSPNHYELIILKYGCFIANMESMYSELQLLQVVSVRGLLACDEIIFIYARDWSEPQQVKCRFV